MTGNNSKAYAALLKSGIDYLIGEHLTGEISFWYKFQALSIDRGIDFFKGDNVSGGLYRLGRG